MVKLLVDSGAKIDMKDKVSTEPYMVLRCDSSLTISRLVGCRNACMVFGRKLLIIMHSILFMD